MERVRMYIMSSIISKSDMDAAENEISSFLSKNNIFVEVPVDIFALATRLGFDVRAADFTNINGGKSLEGMILVDEELEQIQQFKSNKIIAYAYNPDKDIKSIKFIVAHELAHYIDAKMKNNGNKVVIALRDHNDEYSKDKDEQIKDYMAAALLMPRNSIRNKYSKEDYENNSNLHIELAKEYNVDVDVAERRLKEVFDG